MPPRAPERALRRLVADLANAPRAEIEAVLDALSPARRDRVLGLLADYRAQSSRPSPVDVSGLSPWLARHVSAAVAGKDAGAITPRTAQALKDVAGDLLRQSGIQRPATPAPSLAWVRGMMNRSRLGGEA